jgi:chromate transporter
VRSGFVGATVATVAIFAAPFLLVVVAGSTLDRLRSRRFVRAGLRGLTPAVLGLMAAAAIALGDQLSGESEIGIAVAVALTLSRFSLNPALMLLIGGIVRLGLRMVGL